MRSPHYFIAVPLPAFLKEQYARWQYDLQSKLPYKQWTHPDDLHVTLKFLGAVEEDQLRALMTSIKQIKTLCSFSLHTEPLGTFGNPEKPRVLWAGVERKNELLHLQRVIEQMSSQAGFQRGKRPYTPHITLAKKWTGGAMDLTELKRQYTWGQIFEVHQVVIYRIEPEKNPKYHNSATYDLRGGDLNGSAD
ncbi:2'-5' RNA ligase [Lentibacillus halodurans]|uniref:RNA 2',3'-cyclic phosphodiesterase n=1 Tax=Lentibacillus halodurans TaxID=237679 RepID=A0A1I1AGL8_9BACI|nr:RNA 2',3'-cyclic phosphodiesterase [Lentibacillus halodurans]SFB37165.1 2'-5' RNA ligase [Lentibacillus halodurans]